MCVCVSSQRIDAKDLTIFLDRYTRGRSDSRTAEVYRKVVGYEVPVLTRTSVSARAKMLMKPRAAVGPAVPAPSFSATAVGDTGMALDGSTGVKLPPTRPSVVCDPFFLYSCNRSKVKPMFEVDIFVGELTFSLSDRQLQMIAQLLKIASAKSEAPSARASQAPVPPLLSEKAIVAAVKMPAVGPGEAPTSKFQGQNSKTSSDKDSWLGWAMNALGGNQNDEEDDLESEIIAETREALNRVSKTLAADAAAAKAAVKEGPITVVSSLRLCIRTVSLTLRKHPDEIQDETQEVDNDSAEVGVTEELVPVANLGLVRIPVQKTKSRVSRPATPLCTLRLHYVALESIFVQGEERKFDLVFEIERVELLSVGSDSQSTSGGTREDDGVIFEWGSVGTIAFANCVSHPYFINSFYGEESRHLNRRETRSFELVKVSFDTEIPVWKTLESKHAAEQEFDFQKPCECSTVWKGTRFPCTPTSTLHRVCQDVTRTIGLRERTLDGASLLIALTKASKQHTMAIQTDERLHQKLKDVVTEYLHLRSPDLGATENLQQLLLPQLFALLSRQTHHTCGAEMLSSSCLSTDIRRRSVHSAVRLRLSSSRNAQHDAESSKSADAAEKENSSRMLDVSLGQVDASLDPVRCTGVIDLVSTFVSDVLKKDKEEKNGEARRTDSEEVGQTKPVREEPETARRADDLVLVTFSKLHLKVFSNRKHLANLSVLIRDAVYSGSSRDATAVRKSLTVGELSARCTTSRGLQSSESGFQVVGLEFATMTDEVKRDSDKENDRVKNAALAVDRVMATMNDESVLRGCVAVDGLLRAVGVKSFLQDSVLNFPTPARCFRLDVCSVRASLSQTTTSRLNSLNQRVLDTEIGSLSLTSSSPRDPSRLSVEFHSGMNPFATYGLQSEETQTFVTLSLREMRPSGVSCFVPMLSRFLTSEPNSRDAPHTPVYRLHFAVKIAKFEANLKGLLSAATGVTRLRYSLAENWRSRSRESSHEEPSPQLEKVSSTTDTLVPASWDFTLALSSAGGIVRMNEFVEVSVPVISISSPEGSPRVGEPTPGGLVRLECSCGDLKVSMLPSSDGSLLAEKPILLLQGLRGQIAYIHHVDGGQHHHVVDGEVQVASVCVEVSRLTVRRMHWRSLSGHRRIC